MKHFRITTAFFHFFGASLLTAQAENLVKVTPETYIRAETDRQFAEVVRMSGGMNRLYHFRVPTSLDKQNIVRMNRDTLYSMGVVDTSKGATINIIEIIDQQNYIVDVVYPGKSLTVTSDNLTYGNYVYLNMRIRKLTDDNSIQDVLLFKMPSNTNGF